MYEQKVVWVGTILGDSTVEDFENFFLNELGYHVKYVEEFKMTDTGSNCILFGLCGKEVPKFAMFRITTPDMKWFEDWVDNYREGIPEYILNKYKDYLEDDVNDNN